MSIKAEESYGESWYSVNESQYLSSGLPNNRIGNQYFYRRISYNTFPKRCPNDEKKDTAKLISNEKKICFYERFTKVTEHKQPFTSENQACYLYETATWIKYTSLF